MCGLAGLFLPMSATVRDADIDAMVSAIRHRGPDGTAKHISDDHRYQAGFARLAIIDLETGDQPIIEQSGRRVLMGNGEIYNYVELRAGTKAYPYRTSGDMETVMALRDLRPDSWLEALNGIYAIALYDREAHKLTLVRDRLGVKPLYWTRLAGGGILFASEIKALFASGLVKPEIDETAVSSYLAHGYVPAPDTLYRGINKLPPGHILEADRTGDIQIRAYWRPSPADTARGSADDMRESLLELIRDSVRLQLRSDVPVGALLSGGLDSGLIVALAAGLHDRPLQTYTVRFEGAAVDETPLAAELAQRYGTDHTEFDLPAGDVGEILPQLAWFADEPLNDPALLPNFLIEQALSTSVKVVLNGTGGDELFAGYGRYFHQPRERCYMKLPAAIRGIIQAMAPAMPAWQLARAEKFNSAIEEYVFDHSTFFPPPMRALIGNRQTPPISAHGLSLNALDPGRQLDNQTRALMADLTTYLPEDLLTLVDRTSMAVGVEGRVPLLDHRLVEAALAVPETLRTPGGRQKGLLREIADDYLPPSLITAPKQGFAAPVASWIRAGLGKTARRVLTRRATLERGWWTEQGIDALLADPDRHGARLYALLVLELTVRIHVEEPRLGSAPSHGLADYADAA